MASETPPPPNPEDSEPSTGLVTRSIRNDPANGPIVPVIQQIGELQYGVKRIEELDVHQRRSWIKVNRAIVRAQHDYSKLAKLLESIFEEMRDAEEERNKVLFHLDLARRTQELAHDAETHIQDMSDRTVRRVRDVALIGATILWVLLSSSLLVLGVAQDRVIFLGGAGISASLAIGFAKLVFGWGADDRHGEK